MVVADINGNGSPDIATAGNAIEGGDVVWYENNHPEWIKHVIDSNIYGPRFLIFMDVNGDNYRDAVVTADSSVVWYKHPGESIITERSEDKIDR